MIAQSLLFALMPLMQANTALPVVVVPLEAGRWILRETVEQGTGQGGVSASLLAEDGTHRLTVRCDYAYADNVSIQLLRQNTANPVLGLPAMLTRGSDNAVIRLEWEQVPAGLFARDGIVDQSALSAARFLAEYKGPLAIAATRGDGTIGTLAFRSQLGQAAISRVIAACAQ